MPKNKLLATALLILLCVGVVSALRMMRPSPESLLKKRIAERSLGPSNAPVQIEEYLDYQCPPCGTARKLIDEAMKKYPGKIHLQVHYFPLPSHRNGLTAAVHAECVSRQKGKYWKFHEQLFEHQPEWANDAYAELKLLNYAQESGMDLKVWDVCVKDPETAKFVLDEKAKGAALGVATTPSFFINGKLSVGTNGLMEELKKLENKDDASS